MHRRPLLRCGWLLLALGCSMGTTAAERAIDKQVVVNATLDQAWQAWTTREGPSICAQYESTTFHASTVGFIPRSEMRPKYLSMPRRSPARAHTDMSVMYVLSVGSTRSALIRCSTASLASRAPALEASRIISRASAGQGPFRP